MPDNNNKNNNSTPSAIARMRGAAHRYRHWLAALLLVLLAWSLAGFVVAPWLLKKQAIATVREQYDSELRIDSVEINPFVLSLTVRGLALFDPDGDPVATVRGIFANLQLSSLFRWAVTLAEFRIDAPALFVDRNRAGDLNVHYLFETAPEEESTAGDEAEGLPRVLIYDFEIRDCELEWNDRMPEQPVTTRFGPANAEILELNTLPQRSGEQTVVITTESNGTLSWSGKLQLNPLESAGRASVEGRHFALLSEYLYQATGFRIPEGESDVHFAYAVEVDEAGELRAAIDDFDLVFRDMVVHKTEPGTRPAPGAADREVMILPTLSVSDLSFRWPEREIRVPLVVMDDAEVSVYRDDQARINWIPDSGSGETAATEPAAPAEPDWDLRVDRVAVNRLVLGIEDHSVDPHADMGLTSFDMNLTQVSNEEGARIPVEAQMVTRGGGTITVSGDVQVLPSTDIAWQVAAEGVPLALMHPYIKSLADVNLGSGNLAFDVTLKSNDEEPIWLAGDADITDFLITETDEGSRLGSWRRLDVRKFELSMAEETLGISEIAFDGAYADIFIAEDKTVNLGRVEKDPADAAEAARGASEDSAEPETDEALAGQLLIRVGRVLFADSGADFADNSLPLPFAARIAELQGEVSTIASDSREPSTVELEGKVDEHGFVRVSGNVTPLDPALATDMLVAFENVDMPKFSAYSVPFAGREIATGRLDLDLGYRVQESQLEGENHIVLHDFELGRKVEHPGAMSLPLGLAVALLKDANGKIDIELPVRGDLNDPEFKYGGMILKALGNLIVKIVASPFALLGNLIGVEADEISHVDFIAGRADLTPPERERVGKLVEALALRPQLQLELPGAVDREVDGLALRQARVDARIESALSADGEGSDDADYLESRRETLETLYLAQATAADPEADLEALRLEHTSSPPDEDGEPGDPRLDTVALSAELESRLVEAETVSDEELAALADQRAANVRTAVIETDPVLEARVVIGKPREVDGSEESAVPMEVALTADAEAAATEEAETEIDGAE